MIKSKDDLFKSTAEVSLISRALAEDLYKSTKNAKLKTLLDKGKKSVLISLELKSELRSSLEAKKKNMDKARNARTSKGGRPRLPDPADPSQLTGAELKRYQNRKWQREWRANNT